MRNLLHFTVFRRWLLVALGVAAYVLSPAQGNTWVSKANFGGGVRSGAVGFSIGNKGYIGTGADNAALRNDFWEYDPVTNIWTQKANFPGGVRYFATGLSVGNKGYVGMGYAAFNANKKNDFWEYNPAANTWTRKADFAGTPRVYSACFSIGNKGYVGTGTPNDGGPITKDFWEYDPALNKWSRKADYAGAARYAATGFSVGSKGYIGIGEETLRFLKDFWEYNPVTDTWLRKADFGGDARYLASGFGMGNRGYMGLGSTLGIVGGSLKSDFWEYDPLVNTWTRRADYGGGITQASTAFSIANRGYVGTGIGGAGSNPAVGEFWEYTPLSGTPHDDRIVSVVVPGTSNPWLAGMPNGTQSQLGDAAPANSPVLVDLSLRKGSWVEVIDVTGAVAHGLYPAVGPDGCLSEAQCDFDRFIISHDVGAELGKSDLTAPINGLVAVFLNDKVPGNPVPRPLNFTTAISRNYLRLYPQLKQVFYIGNGRTNSGIVQKIFIPKGATRLYLGTMDGIEWNNNQGAFHATVKLVSDRSSNRCGFGNNKVSVCHKGKTICISRNALSSHLHHGDRIGGCSYFPDKHHKDFRGDASVLEETASASFNISSSPNPVRNMARIQYELPAGGQVQITLYDATGRTVSSPVNATHHSGTYFKEFDTKSFSKGIYYYQVRYTTLQAGVHINTGKLIVVK